MDKNNKLKTTYHKLNKIISTLLNELETNIEISIQNRGWNSIYKEKFFLILDFHLDFMASTKNLSLPILIWNIAKMRI